MNHKTIWIATAAFALVMGETNAARAWQPPLGIPMPPFGINEAAPPMPNPWTTPAPGFYYVDATAPGATDSGNPYGTPGRPRWTIPLSLPAGAVVELHGTYDYSHASPYILRPEGTAAEPVFIRGHTIGTKPLVRRPWQVSGTYFIIENLEFGPFDDTASNGVTFVAPASYGVLRHSDVHGNLVTGGVGVVSWGSMETSYAVIYANKIHDNGDVNANYDQDVHGIGVSGRVHHLWVLDNELYRNSGDGIQINAGGLTAQPTTHHIYVGRNVAHHNKQSGFWTKQAVDVIFSQNVAYSHRPSNSSSGAGLGFQYAPQRVWFLFNHIYDSDFGIFAGSNSGLGFGTESYFIGNVIHDIHSSRSYNPGSGWSQAAIMLAGGVNRFVVNNTIFDVDAGINSPSAGPLQIVNNLIGQITGAQGNHVFIETSTAAAASTMHHNLFEGAVRIKWGSATVYNLASFQAAFPGKGLDSVNANPLFLDALNEDFRLQAASPAVDAGTTDGVYSTFFTLYGIDLVKDISGTPRPQGPRYDLGAYEFAIQPMPPSAPTGRDVK
jgi:hypothetical protein